MLGALKGFSYLPHQMSWVIPFFFLTYLWLFPMLNLSRESLVTHTTPVSHGSSWLINGFSYMTKTWLIMIVLEIKQKHASCKAKKIKMC